MVRVFLVHRHTRFTLLPQTNKSKSRLRRLGPLYATGGRCFFSQGSRTRYLFLPILIRKRWSGREGLSRYPERDRRGRVVSFAVFKCQSKSNRNSFMILGLI